MSEMRNNQRSETKTSIPAWFPLAERAMPETLKRLEVAVEKTTLPLQVNCLPSQAFWFLRNSLYIANQANRLGMHANALSITRQCLEALSVIELGLCSKPQAADQLRIWEEDRATAGEVWKWLEANAWPGYGNGLWDEPWVEFMGSLSRAIQPYAHYSAKLAQWQYRVHLTKWALPNDGIQALVEVGPATYDPQKATRITLYHVLITFALARVWIATRDAADNAFAALIDELRIALGRSVYLDGPGTQWDQQFWAMLFFKNGRQNPE